MLDVVRDFLAELAVAITDCKQVLKVGSHHVGVEDEGVLVLLLGIVGNVSSPSSISIFSDDVVLDDGFVAVEEGGRQLDRSMAGWLLAESIPLELNLMWLQLQHLISYFVGFIRRSGDLFA